MVIVVFDSLGNCRIGSPIIARSPISRINRLTTSASTGRRMKMSVNDMLRVARCRRSRESGNPGWPSRGASPDPRFRGGDDEPF